MLSKLFKIIVRKIRGIRIKFKYKLKGKINIYGKVYLDNPNITFGNNVHLYHGLQIWGKGIIKIGDNVAIGKDTIILANKEIVIEDNSIIAGQCYIIDCDHGIKKDNLIINQSLVNDSIYIGQDVWIGAGAKILKGSNIKDGCVIGAGSVVTHKLKTKNYEIYGGIPAKKISQRR